jgi:hypothetical protein
MDPDPPDPHVFGPPGSGSDPPVTDMDPDSLIWIRIRILLSSSKNSKKSLDSYCLVTSFGPFAFENDVNVPSKSNKQNL